MGFAIRAGIANTGRFNVARDAVIAEQVRGSKKMSELTLNPPFSSDLPRRGRAGPRCVVRPSHRRGVNSDHSATPDRISNHRRFPAHTRNLPRPWILGLRQLRRAGDLVHPRLHRFLARAHPHASRLDLAASDAASHRGSDLPLPSDDRKFRLATPGEAPLATLSRFPVAHRWLRRGNVDQRPNAYPSIM